MNSDLLKWIWRSFIWARGFVAAVSLVAIFDGLFGWDRVEFLRFTHALVIHWDQLLRLLLAPILAVFDLPEVSRDLLSVTVMVLVYLPIVTVLAFRSIVDVRTGYKMSIPPAAVYAAAGGIDIL